MTEMKKYFMIMFYFVLTGGVFAQEVKVQAGQSDAQKKFQDELTTFLTEEGFTPQVNPTDYSITFEQGGIPHWIYLKGESPFFVVMGRDGYDLRGKSDSERACVLQAGNETGQIRESVKIVCTETAAQIRIEQYTRSAEDFKYVFYSNLRMLTAACDDFIKLYGQCIIKRDTVDSKSVPQPQPQPMYLTGDRMLLERMRTQSPTLYLQYMSAHRKVKKGRFCLILGSVLAGTGVILAASEDSTEGVTTIGTLSILGGAGLVGGGIGSMTGGKAMKRRALQEFQRNTAELNDPAPYFRINLTGNGIGLAYVF
jgi:hypothetical protein